MQLRLTVIDPTCSGAAVDCVVDAPSGGLCAIRPDLLGAWGAATACSSAQPSRSATTSGRDSPTGGRRRGDGGAGDRADRHARRSSCTSPPVPTPAPSIRSARRALHRARGRGQLRIEDPDVSRLHALLRVGPGGAGVADLDSTNGTTVGGAPTGRSGCRSGRGGDSGGGLPAGAGAPPTRARPRATPMVRAAAAQPSAPVAAARPVSPSVTFPAAPAPREKPACPSSPSSYRSSPVSAWWRSPATRPTWRSSCSRR